MVSKSKALEQFTEHHSITEAGLDLQYELAELNHNFYSGNEMAYSVSVTDNSARRIVIFNRIKPFVNAITGFFIKLRRKPDYQARQKDNELQKSFTEHTNAFSDYLRSDANLPQIESRQDKEMLITGVGGIDTSITYLKNPFGEVAAESLRFDEVGWDPQARATDLLDARWVYRRKIMNRDDAAKLLSADPEDFEDADSPLSNRTFRSRSYVSSGSKEEEDLVQIFYYQWWEFEKYYRIDNPVHDAKIDPFTREQLMLVMQQIKIDITEDNDEADPKIIEDLFEFDPEAQELVVTSKTRGVLNEIFDEFGIKPDEVKHKRKVYYTALISRENVFQVFKAPDQNGFTIKFKTGDYDEVRNVWHGMVDQLREPSRYANKALTEILYVIASNSKGGIMYEEDAVVDTKRFEQQWATTDAAIRVRAGALSGNKIQPKAQSQLPSGYDKVLDVAKSAMFETSGINPEFLGSSENKQVSALLEAQRIDQVTSTLATYVDSITLYQKEHGRLMLTNMRTLSDNNSDLLFTALGEEGALVFRQVDNSALLSEYQIDIQETPTTPVQKAHNLTVLMTLAQQMQLSGINIYPALIDDLPISRSQKEKLKNLIDPQPTPEQLQQQQLQQNLAIQKARLDMTEQETDIIKKKTETAKVQVDIPKIKAETVKILEDAEQTDLENRHLAIAQLSDLSIVI